MEKIRIQSVDIQNPPWIVEHRRGSVLMRRYGRKKMNRQFLPNAESCETRQLLATSPLNLTGLQSLIGAARVDRRTSAGATLSAAATPAGVDQIVLVNNTPSYNPQFRYNTVLTSGASSYGYNLQPVGRNFQSSIGVSGTQLPIGSTLQLQVLTGLTYWNGRGTPNFSTVNNLVEMNLNASGQNLRIGARTDQAVGQKPGTVRQTLTVGVSDGLSFNEQILTSIGTGGRAEIFSKPGASSGIYAFTGLWTVPNVQGIRDSVPVTYLFAIGSGTAANLNAAVSYFSSSAKQIPAVVAVETRYVEPDGYGQKYIQVDVMYSAPVSANGRSPQLPIMFGSTQRMAELQRNSDRTNTNVLTFVYTPNAQELSSSDIRLGTAIRVNSGSSITSNSGINAIASLPTNASRSDVVVNIREQVSVISSDITRNTTFRSGTLYVIDGNVHVRAGVTLTIDDNVTILIRNGWKNTTKLVDTSALIFDSGSKMNAKTVYFKSADDTNNPVNYANNGGVFFLGTTRSASMDGVTTDTSRRNGTSSFIANMIDLSYVGRRDPFGGDGDDNVRDDKNAITLLGLGQNEWRVKAVRSEGSGDDGFDVTNSSITMDSLTVVNPTEDGINNSSSLLQINKQVTVLMTGSNANDRELFDLEVGDGQARIVFNRRSSVNLRGYWGSAWDEVDLNSLDMPQPNRRGFLSSFYEYQGVLTRGPAIIYSVTAD